MSDHSAASAPTDPPAPGGVLGDAMGVRLPEWAYGLIAVAVAVAYWAFSRVNVGFHMHDGISHYLNMKALWYDPAIGLSIWQKPGYKYLMAPFAQLGEPLMIWIHCFFLAGAAYISGKVVERMGYPGLRVLVMILVAFQPIVWQTAFRFHSENFVAFLLAGFLWAWYARKYTLAALLVSFAMVTRFELGLIAAAVGLILLLRRRYVPAFLTALFPVVLNFAGYFHTLSDPSLEPAPFFFVTDMLLSGGHYEYTQFGFFYNWKMLSPAVGVVVVGLAVVGLFPVGIGWPRFRQHLTEHGILYIYFGSIFIGFCLFTSPWFPFLQLQTQDQAYVQFAPAIALLAALGFAHLASGVRKEQLGGLGVLGFYTVLILAFQRVAYVHPNRFLYTRSDGQVIEHAPIPADAATTAQMLPVSEMSYVIVALIVLAGAAGLVFLRLRPVLLLGLVSIAFMGHTFATEKKRELYPEEATCKQVADFVKQHKLDTATVLAQHNIFHYFNGSTITETGKVQRLRWGNVLQAPKNSVLIWDTHYSFKQWRDDKPKLEQFRNVPQDSLVQHPEWFRPLTDQPFVSSDRKFAIYLFRKTVGPIPLPESDS